MCSFDQCSYSASSFGEVYIPQNAEFDRKSRFTAECPARSINVDPDHPRLCSLEGVLFTKNGKTLLKYPSEKPGDVYVVPEGVEVIGSNAFSNTRLKAIFLPKSLKVIESHAFVGSKSLVIVTIQPGLKVIGNGAFKSCSQLLTIIVPETVSRIEKCAFNACSSLNLIVVDPNNKKYCSFEGALFTKDGKKLLKYPEGRTIERYELPQTTTEIGAYALAGCKSTKTVALHKNVKRVGEGAFLACDSLESIDVDPNNRKYRSVDGVLFSKDGNVLVYYPKGRKNEIYAVPEGVAVINAYAFSLCDSLKIVSLPKSVTVVGHSAFYGCEKIESFHLPKGVRFVGVCAFRDCKSLKSIRLPDDMKQLLWGAFAGCKSLRSIELPNGLKTIAAETFYGCANLKSISLPKNASGIESGAFFGCKSLKSIELPESLLRIGKGAFCNCASLTSIKFPESTFVVGFVSFCGCKSLETVTIPQQTFFVAKDAFLNCPALTSIDVEPDNTHYQSIDGVLFKKDGTSLVKYPEGKQDYMYAVPEGVTTVGPDAFRMAKALKEILFPDSVKTIHSGAFWDCRRLTFRANADSFVEEYAWTNEINFELLG